MQAFDLEQLRTLVAVVEAGSLTAAAPRVFLSQSAVSEQMRKLEERVGQALLTRSKAGVVPTPAGVRLVTHARKLLALSDEAFRDLRGEALRANCALPSRTTSGRATWPGSWGALEKAIRRCA